MTLAAPLVLAAFLSLQTVNSPVDGVHGCVKHLGDFRVRESTALQPFDLFGLFAVFDVFQQQPSQDLRYPAECYDNFGISHLTL